jgi:hypothetical protein
MFQFRNRDFFSVREGVRRIILEPDAFDGGKAVWLLQPNAWLKVHRPLPW